MSASQVLVGVLVDVSASMITSMGAGGGQSLNRLQSLQRAWDELILKARDTVRASKTQRELPAFRLFAYGFGFGNPLTALLGQSTGPVRNLLGPETNSHPAVDLTDLIDHWSTYRGHIESLVKLMFGETPMASGLQTVRRSFEAAGPQTVKLLFFLSDGDPTDAAPEAIAALCEEIRSAGVTIISCFVTDRDVAEPRRLFAAQAENWPPTARMMFDCASTLTGGAAVVGTWFSELGWRVEPAARLFAQVNHSEVLGEFMTAILSPLRRESATPPPLLSTSSSPAAASVVSPVPPLAGALMPPPAPSSDAPKPVVIEALGDQEAATAVSGVLKAEDMDPKESPVTTAAGPDTRFFVVGCLLLVTAIGFLAWGFSLPSDAITVARQRMLAWILALASGFAAGAFTGGFTIRARGIVPGLVATATGGFAVWFFTFNYLFPSSRSVGQTFSVPLIVHRDGRPDDRKGINGNVELDFPGAQTTIVSNGRGILQFIPSYLNGRPLSYSLDLPHFAPVGQAKLTLTPDTEVYIAVTELPAESLPPPSPPDKRISVVTPVPVTLEWMVSHVASTQPGLTIWFAETCTARVRKARLPAGEYAAEDVLRLLRLLPLRVDGRAPQYEIKETSGVRYEIVCSKDRTVLSVQ